LARPPQRHQLHRHPVEQIIRKTDGAHSLQLADLGQQTLQPGSAGILLQLVEERPAAADAVPVLGGFGDQLLKSLNALRRQRLLPVECFSHVVFS
jgi:hypothetical protein